MKPTTSQLFLAFLAVSTPMFAWAEGEPTLEPTASPTLSPTSSPTLSPTSSPTEQCIANWQPCEDEGPACCDGDNGETFECKPFPDPGNLTEVAFRICFRVPSTEGNSGAGGGEKESREFDCRGSRALNNPNCSRRRKLERPRGIRGAGKQA